METISGVSNWQLTIRREEAGITILRAQTCDARAYLPERLYDLPVIALGHHALSGGRTDPGEELRITHGRGEGDWDNHALEELHLPSTLERVGDYALLNCRSLQRLCLSDSVRIWGSGVLMNCRSLGEIHLRWGEEQGETLDYFAGELSRELDVSIETPRGAARLIFPEYTEIYEENCPAHHFDYTILGAGYPYHHCFRQRRFAFGDYDALWEKFLAMEHEPFCALRLAWWRLACPLDLSEAAERGYRDYLRSRPDELLDWLLESRNAAGVGDFLRWGKPGADTLRQACAKAREQGNTESLALLLEAGQGERRPRKSFDL